MRFQWPRLLLCGAMLLLGSQLVQAEATSTQFNLIESVDQIAVHQGGKLVLAYNKRPPEVPPGIDPVYARSGFLHPVASPNGSIVTAAYPADHAHQNGIFAAWVKTRFRNQKVDFWNLAKRLGRVTHHRVVSTFCGADSAGFVVELTHQARKAMPNHDTAEPQAYVDVLRETWKVACYAKPLCATSKSVASHVFEIESQQRILTAEPLHIEEYHYGGMAIRGPASWVLGDSDDRSSYFLNDSGSNRAEGNHEAARWVAMSGNQQGQPVTIAVLSHLANYRSPQKARLHPTKPYFCFAPCVDGEFVIDKDHPLHSRFRFLVTDGIPDSEWVSAEWSAWCADEESRDDQP